MKRLREGQKVISHAGFAAFVQTEVNIAPQGQPPKHVKKFLRVGPCLPNRDSVERYLKEDYVGDVGEYRIQGIRVDVTPLALPHPRAKGNPSDA